MKGWCDYTFSEKHKRRRQNHYFRYRLERIEAVTLLPKRGLDPPPKATKYKVEYKLSKKLVRSGISEQRWIDFSKDDIEYLPSGEVIVTGYTDQDFFALQ